MRVLSRRREADVWLTLSGGEPGLGVASGDEKLGTRAAASGEPGLGVASGDDGELGTRAAASGEPGLDSASGDDGELGTRAAASGEPGRDSASGDNEGPGGGIIAPPRARFPYRRGG